MKWVILVNKDYTWYLHINQGFHCYTHAVRHFTLCQRIQLYLNFACGSGVTVEVAEDLVGSFVVAGVGRSLL